MVFGCTIFGVLSNMIGVKKVLIIGTLGYAPYSASLYVNNRYGTEWFVLFGGVTCGIAASALWASEGAIALGYGKVEDRGKFGKSVVSPVRHNALRSKWEEPSSANIQTHLLDSRYLVGSSRARPAHRRVHPAVVECPVQQPRKSGLYDVHCVDCSAMLRTAARPCGIPARKGDTQRWDTWPRRGKEHDSQGGDAQDVELVETEADVPARPHPYRIPVEHDVSRHLHDQVVCYSPGFHRTRAGSENL